MRRVHGSLFFVFGALLVAATAYGSGGAPGPGTQTGTFRKTAATCYPGVADAGTLKGTVTCLTQVTGGYCTHECTADSDCCAVPGECHTNVKEVCSPFESQPQKYCFLSCETADVQAAGYTDPTAYCQQLGNHVHLSLHRRRFEQPQDLLAVGFRRRGEWRSRAAPSTSPVTISLQFMELAAFGVGAPNAHKTSIRTDFSGGRQAGRCSRRRSGSTRPGRSTRRGV